MYKKLQSKNPANRATSPYRTPVNTQEFESQYQESVSKILNELQSMAIISNRLESSIVEVGSSVQSLNKMVEDYLKQHPENAEASDKKDRINRDSERLG